MELALYLTLGDPMINENEMAPDLGNSSSTGFQLSSIDT